MVDNFELGKYYLLNLKRSELLAYPSGTYAITFATYLQTNVVPLVAQSQSAYGFGSPSVWSIPNTARSVRFDVNTTLQTITMTALDSSHNPVGTPITYNDEYITLYGCYDFVNNTIRNYALQNAQPYSLLLQLGLLSGEKNYVSKETDGEVSFYVTLVGTPRDELDVMNPSILVELNNLPRYNYVKIYQLHRTYFIKNIICIRDRLYRLELHVDVLNTYDTLILNQEDFYVTRNENAYDTSLVDDRLPLSDIPIIDVYSASSYDTPAGSNIKNLFSFNFDYDDLTRPHYVLNNFGPIINYCSHAYPVTPPATYDMEYVESPHSQMSDVGPLDLHSRGSYIVDFDDIRAIAYASKASDTARSGIESIVAYPFNVDSFVTYKRKTAIVVFGGEHAYYLGNDTGPKWIQGIAPTPFPYSAPLCLQNTLDYLVIADFTFPSSYAGDDGAFVEYEPKTTYELYVPFLSWVSISAVDLLDKRIIVYYAIDISTGEGTAYIRNITDNRTIYSAPVVLGVKIPLTTTNAYEIQQQQKNATNNLIMTLFTGVSAIAGGVAMENPAIAIGGVMGIAGGIKNYVNTENIQIGKTQGVTGSPESAIMDGHRVWIRAIRHSPITIDYDVYGRMNGYPCKNYSDDLSAFSGYTEVGDIHFAPQENDYITSDEIDEIVSLLKQGVIL